MEEKKVIVSPDIAPVDTEELIGLIDERKYAEFVENGLPRGGGSRKLHHPTGGCFPKETADPCADGCLKINQ